MSGTHLRPRFSEKECRVLLEVITSARRLGNVSSSLISAEKKLSNILGNAELKTMSLEESLGIGEWEGVGAKSSKDSSSPNPDALEISSLSSNISNLDEAGKARLDYLISKTYGI